MPDEQDNLKENETLQGEENQNPAMEEQAATTQNENDVLKQQIAELKDQFIRERAENDNLRKRQERELSNAHKYAAERLLKDLLPVLDSLTLGLQAEKEAKEKLGEQNAEALDQFIQGSEMTLTMLRETLQKHGVEEIDPAGEKFDPEKHEAVTMVPSAEHEINTVMHVAQKGYVLNGRVIRAAQVIVAKDAG